jgi:hypothetical protein
MKKPLRVWVVRRNSTGEHLGRTYSRWTVKTPRMFTRTSDLTTHLKIALQPERVFPKSAPAVKSELFGVPISDLTIREFNLDQLTETHIPLETYVNDLINRGIIKQ